MIINIIDLAYYTKILYMCTFIPCIVLNALAKSLLEEFGITSNSHNRIWNSCTIKF